MQVKTTYSKATEISSAVGEITQNLKAINPAFIIYFASPAYPPEELAKVMDEAFSGTTVIGCSTSGEIVSGKMLDQSIVAMGFPADFFSDFHVELIENLKQPNEGINKAVENHGTHFGMPLQEMDYQAFAGILLLDGLSGAEENVIDILGNYTNIPVVGGSAGDDLKFEKTWVFIDGKAYSNAALFAIIKPVQPFAVLKTQSFNTTGKKLTVTKADDSSRKVLEFNGEPASKAYAEALNSSLEDLPAKMFRSPLGLMVNETEPFVRSPRVVEDNNVFFYCSVLEGMELEVLESTNIVEDTQKALESKKKELGGISAVLNFHCILRTLDLKDQNKTNEYGQVFADIPTLGFSTYGECYLGHINQTSTMLLFK